jgi:hypothetical protein
MKHTTRIPWGIITLLLIMWGLLTVQIGVPWFGHHDANGVEFMTMARNYELYGAPELGFLQLRNYEIPAEPENYNFYLHHPPMISWVLGLAGVPFSLTEASSRWAMICATMISISALYVLARRLLGKKRALLVVMLYGLTPMIAYFGRMPNHEPLVMGFLMPFITIYAQYLRYPTRARWLALAILAIFSMWTAWAAAFFFMALLFFGVIYRVETRLKKIITEWQKLLDLVGLGIVVVVATIAVPLFYESQREGAIQQLLDVMVFRTSSVGGSRGAPTFTILEYIARQLIHMATMMTLFVVVMGFVGVKPLLRQSRLTRTMTWAMLAGGLGFLIFFRNASYIHDYYKYYLMPAFSIMACLGVAWAWGLRRLFWVKPAILGLLLGSTIYSVLIFVGSHASANQPFPMEIANAINAHSTTQELILTNLTRQSPAIEFYAERRITYEIIPEKALEIVAESTQVVIYVFCLDPLPENLQSFPYEEVVDGDCYIIQMNGASDEKAP